MLLWHDVFFWLREFLSCKTCKGEEKRFEGGKGRERDKRRVRSLFGFSVYSN